MGLADCTLRLPANASDFKDQLAQAVVTLFDLYSGSDRRGKVGYFDVTVTCNLILASVNRDGKTEYGVYYGSDYNEQERTLLLSEPVTLQSIGDLDRLPTAFTIETFKDGFEALHENSNVQIFDIVNIIYSFRRPLENFQRDAIAPSKLVKYYSETPRVPKKRSLKNK